MTTSVPATSFTDPAPAERLEWAAAALTAHGFAVEILDDDAAARTRVKDLIPEGASVFTGASETLRLSGSSRRRRGTTTAADGCLVASWKGTGMLIIVAGLPGSGKSTLAGDLGRALGCAVLGVDQAEAAMWRAGVTLPAPTHHAAYLVVAALAAEQLALGHDVIIDAVSGPEMARAQWRELAARTNARLRFIIVECGDDRLYRDRVEHRSRSIEGYPEPTWEGILRRRASFPPWTDERLTIDSVNPRETNLQAALDYLPADPEPPSRNRPRTDP